MSGYYNETPNLADFYETAEGHGVDPGMFVGFEQAKDRFGPLNQFVEMLKKAHMYAGKIPQAQGGGTQGAVGGGNVADALAAAGIAPPKQRTSYSSGGGTSSGGILADILRDASAGYIGEPSGPAPQMTRFQQQKSGMNLYNPDTDIVISDSTIDHSGEMLPSDWKRQQYASQINPGSAGMPPTKQHNLDFSDPFANGENITVASEGVNPSYTKYLGQETARMGRAAEVDRLGMALGLGGGSTQKQPYNASEDVLKAILERGGELSDTGYRIGVPPQVGGGSGGGGTSNGGMVRPIDRFKVQSSVIDDDYNTRVSSALKEVDPMLRSQRLNHAREERDRALQALMAEPQEAQSGAPPMVGAPKQNPGILGTISNGVGHMADVALIDRLVAAGMSYNEAQRRVRDYRAGQT